MAGYVALVPLGGETFGSVQQRAVALLAELMAAPDPTPTPALLFIPGGTIRPLLCYCLNIPLHKAFQLRTDFAFTTKLNYQHERWNLSGFNG